MLGFAVVVVVVVAVEPVVVVVEEFVAVEPLLEDGATVVPASLPCVTTNVMTLAVAGVTGAAVYLTRGVRRILFAKSA